MSSTKLNKLYYSGTHTHTFTHIKYWIICAWQSFCDAFHSLFLCALCTKFAISVVVFTVSLWSLFHQHLLQNSNGHHHFPFDDAVAESDVSVAFNHHWIVDRYCIHFYHFALLQLNSLRILYNLIYPNATMVLYLCLHWNTMECNTMQCIIMVERKLKFKV